MSLRSREAQRRAESLRNLYRLYELQNWLTLKPQRFDRYEHPPQKFGETPAWYVVILQIATRFGATTLYQLSRQSRINCSPC